ncbi:diguanylate cyclase (GGDEF) domain-containing protein [Hungatella hathewayi 12489931]|nr:diguanylate cyclase (GGDEF) domain-containing protein [Hungatella hathewayi 12489931]
MLLQKKILIVEDNEINRFTLRVILSPEYTVLEAEDGEQALAMLEEYGEDISLILLDIIMPVMDGYTFLKHLTEDTRISSIPVIVTTSNDSEAEEVAALGRGATDFISKPYRSQVILHRVASIIKLRETAAILNMFQYDRLTGVYSKEFFYQQVQSILFHSPDVKYDILCSDIENFKLINDAFGVAAGDHLLQEVANLHRQCLGTRGICGRLNADQFVCLLEHRADYADEMFVQSDNKINNGFDDKNVIIKYGIYIIHDREVPVEQMCDRALLAVQSIKGQYGKHFAIYNDRLREKLRGRQAITDGMEAALATGQFEVYLQPKYRIWDGQLAGAEALVRWNHPERGMMPPGEFIPLFEQNGFITKLDQFVWERSCALLQKWDLKGYPKIEISVNVSRRDIHNVDISDILTGIIQRYGLTPYRLHLEITESAYTDNPKQIIDMVSRLRGMGFIIEMDDFGSGYSSLNMLSDLPIDILKLDMKFIQTETAKPAGQGILRFIVSLARYMNLSVVAEGVETREQLDRLRENGCDYAQGYYFAKPMPASDFEKMLALVPKSGGKSWHQENDHTEHIRDLGPL